MRIRPILFSSPMVRALHDGRKTQTRRVLKVQPDPELHGEPREVGMFAPTVVDRHGDEDAGPEVFGCWTKDGEFALRCPYGQPGDLLWVRERVLYNSEPGRDESPWVYFADMRDHAEAVQTSEDCNANWRPSIHMPRRATRLTLRIGDMRVQRLNEISDGDCVAEGVDLSAFKLPGDTALVCFRRIWEGINGQFSWGDNPWVWALTFEVLRENVDAVLARAEAA